MILSNKKKLVLNITGIIIISFWLSMMFLLIKKEHSGSQGKSEEDESSMIAITSDTREWKEIFLDDKKVGYSVSRINPFEKGYLIHEDVFLKLNLMGMARNVHTVTRSVLDADFRLNNFYFQMTSGIVRFAISGKLEGKHLVIESGTGRRKKIQKIYLDKEPMIGAGMGFFFQAREIKVGDDFMLPLFDPSTMAEKDAHFRVVAKEKIEINNITYDSFRIEAEMWGNRMTFWLDEDGSTLKEEGFMGLSTIKSSAANAPLNIEMEDIEDFYEKVAVPLDRIMPDPERLKSVRFRVEGLDNMPMILEILNTGRQNYNEGILTIAMENLPSDIGFSDPDKGPAENLKPYLAPEYNIESDSEEVMEAAKNIVSGETNNFEAAKRLMKWVYENIEKKPVISIPSALEVLRTRTGDCNEHATLLTAFLRASGIPSRICVGLVYNQDRFFYHAWSEAYFGKWVSMDATLNQIPADVSHISLMHGNLEKQIEIAGVIGKISLKLIDYSYD
ncbi:MAG: lasso peptide biosynthesis protein [Deltaproteobacteria bacterium]|nr:lasso peptide biosynthesis protein [Deltaproteobacteria bacterium]